MNSRSQHAVAIEKSASQIDNHLILTTYREVLQAERKPVQPLALRIENQIPIGKGCGSSAAARLAGIALAAHFGRLRWTDNRIVYEAAQREHHPDNAAACWMGGLAIAQISADGEMRMAHVRPKGKWPLLLAVPNERLSTEDARRVLPNEYSRADAVANIQNSMLLLAAFLQGRKDLASVRIGRSHPSALPRIAVPFAARVAETDRNSRNIRKCVERGRTFCTDFSRPKVERESSQKAGARPPASARTQPGVDSHGDRCARSEPADSVRSGVRQRAGSTTRIFVCAGRRFCGHNVGQVLLETQVRFAGEPIRIRIDGSKKTVYFSLDSLDFILSFNFRNP